jgi:hypothetical protein
VDEIGTNAGSVVDAQADARVRIEAGGGARRRVQGVAGAARDLDHATDPSIEGQSHLLSAGAIRLRAVLICSRTNQAKVPTYRRPYRASTT